MPEITGQVAYATKLSAHRSPASTKIPRFFRRVLSTFLRWFTQVLSLSPCVAPHHFSKSLGEAKIHGIRIHGLQAKKKAETAKDGFFGSEKKDAKAEPNKNEEVLLFGP